MRHIRQLQLLERSHRCQAVEVTDSHARTKPLSLGTGVAVKPRVHRLAAVATIGGPPLGSGGYGFIEKFVD